MFVSSPQLKLNERILYSGAQSSRLQLRSALCAVESNTLLITFSMKLQSGEFTLIMNVTSWPRGRCCSPWARDDLDRDLGEGSGPPGDTWLSYILSNCQGACCNSPSAFERTGADDVLLCTGSCCTAHCSWGIIY